MSLQRFLCCILLGCLLLFCLCCAHAGSGFKSYEELYLHLVETVPGPGDPAFSSLPEETRALYIAAMLDMEVQCGGISAFFMNEGEAAAVLAAGSLRCIGLEEMAQLYEGFLSEHGIDPADLSDFHCETVQDVQRIYSDYAYLDEFDQAYMQLWSKLGFEERMLEFAA